MLLRAGQQNNTRLKPVRSVKMVANPCLDYYWLFQNLFYFHAKLEQHHSGEVHSK